jgi:hypothetical protein
MHCQPTNCPEESLFLCLLLVDTYRTLCIAPSHEIRLLFQAIGVFGTAV